MVEWLVVLCLFDCLLCLLGDLLFLLCGLVFVWFVWFLWVCGWLFCGYLICLLCWFGCFVLCGSLLQYSLFGIYFGVFRACWLFAYFLLALVCWITVLLGFVDGVVFSLDGFVAVGCL